MNLEKVNGNIPMKIHFAVFLCPPQNISAGDARALVVDYFILLGFSSSYHHLIGLFRM
jgi:hypothetical protein